jgi:hypothetical protein
MKRVHRLSGKITVELPECLAHEWQKTFGLPDQEDQ